MVKSDQILIAILSFFQKLSLDNVISGIGCGSFFTNENFVIWKNSFLPITFTNKAQVTKND